MEEKIADWQQMSIPGRSHGQFLFVKLQWLGMPKGDWESPETAAKYGPAQLFIEGRKSAYLSSNTLPPTPTLPSPLIPLICSI
jgi:hypothetical protein